MKRFFEKGSSAAQGMVFLALLLFCLGCPGEDPVEGVDVGPQDDVGTNGDDVEQNSTEPEGPFVIEDPYDLVPYQPNVDTRDGHPDIEAGVPGVEEVRVGRIAGEETGFTGVWSHCRSGDFLLSNSEIVVCIQNETTNRYETYTGGKLVDARRHDQPPGEDVLDMIMPLIDIGTATSDNVEVIRDGSDGVAVLRVSGQDIDLAHLAGVLGSRIGQQRSLQVVTEYRLLPGSTAVEIVTLLRAPQGQTYSALRVGEWFAFGDRARGWTPGSGFGIASSSMPWTGAMGDGHSFGLVFEDKATPLGVMALQGIPYAEMQTDTLVVRHSEYTAYRRWFVVGDGSIDSVRRAAAEVRGEDLPGQAMTVRVNDDDGVAMSGVEVVVRQDGSSITAGVTDDEGELELWLETGSYEAVLSDFAGPLAVERPFEQTGDDVVLTLPQVARLKVEVQEIGTEAPITSRVRFTHPDVGTWHEYAVAGHLDTIVPAGQLQMIVTRGMEYDFFEVGLDLEPGSSNEEMVSLLRGVDTDGWRSGDFHQHMEPSIDSRVNVHVRVLENASQGVELMVPTDHEVITDLQPVVDKMGLGHELSTFPGVEISPLYAHFNLYPVPYRPHLRGRGSIELAYRPDREVFLRRMPEIIAMARQFETNPIVQMNHPRNSSGMLNHVSFDPELGPEAVTHEDFVIEVDTMEIINRYGDVCQILADWSGLLNAGHRITGLGNSDTHHANGEAGAPRNYMPLDVAPGEITPELASQALRAGQVTVASHAFIDFGDGTLPGDEVAVDGQGLASFNVRVQTPDWSEAQTLFVIVNGSVVQTIERTAEAGARFDFDEIIEVEVEEDSWVIFWADGPRPTAAVPQRKEVIAFTNPVFLTTGAGDWQAPGVQPLDLAAINTGYCS